eukprot:TRINITY_DN13961_c0_g1_i1.p1 TRINITY_DN13961_c0_g1~~TRINITY_DN13961_c0_g1_i1.p1  ORF type:complete len:419 (+),score=115.93 TRINITY_DN13961_c0_g1_i1:81-1337(+)
MSEKGSPSPRAQSGGEDPSAAGSGKAASEHAGAEEDTDVLREEGNELDMDDDSDAGSEHDAASVESKSGDDASVGEALDSFREEALRCLRANAEKVRASAARLRDAQKQRRKAGERVTRLQEDIRAKEDQQRRTQSDLEKRRSAAKAKLDQEKKELARLEDQVASTRARRLRMEQNAGAAHAAGRFDAAVLRRKARGRHMDEVRVAVTGSLERLFDPPTAKCALRVLDADPGEYLAATYNNESAAGPSHAALTLHLLLAVAEGRADPGPFFPADRPKAAQRNAPAASGRKAPAAAAAAPHQDRRQRRQPSAAEPPPKRARAGAARQTNYPPPPPQPPRKPASRDHAPVRQPPPQPAPPPPGSLRAVGVQPHSFSGSEHSVSFEEDEEEEEEEDYEEDSETASPSLSSGGSGGTVPLVD